MRDIPQLIVYFENGRPIHAQFQMFAQKLTSDDRGCANFALSILALDKVLSLVNSIGQSA
ncbi:hypothetical protein D3C87_1987900 [compost metagenome]